MSDIILHEYPGSPFSEKIRRILAYKGLPWRAVDQPVIAPKPDLTPLTGGYRRIPVMQLGADIYCDTALIARRLEVLYPQPAVIPTALAGTIALLEDWADHRLFMQAVPPAVVELVDQLPAGFIEDRQAMSPGFSAEALTAAAPHALAQTVHACDRLDAQLELTPFLLGDAFTLADAAVYHVLWLGRNAQALGKAIAQRPGLKAWMERIEAFGAGEVTPMSGADALAVAREAQPADLDGDSLDDAGFAPGDRVEIVADDYGRETTTGVVLRVRANELSVMRDDEQVGSVAVHYPRAGYRVARLG